MTRLIDADELLAALASVPCPRAVLEAIRAAPGASGVMTYAEVLQVYRDKMDAEHSMDAALFKVAWVAFNRGLAAAGS